VKKKRPPVMLVTSLVIAVLVFFLPSLLCLPPVIDYGQRLLSRQLSVSLSMQSCSLGWLQGVRCENLRYQDPAKGIRVTSPQIAGDKGLLLLLLAPRYLGELTAEQPTLTFLPLAADVANSAPAAVESSGAGQTGGPTWWERITCKFAVHKGLVELDQGSRGRQEIARAIDIKGSLAEGTVEYSLAFRSGLEQEGHLRARGFVNLPTARQSPLDSLISRTEVDIKDLELSAFLDLAASRSDFPRGGGVLAASGQVVTAGIEAFEVRGETSLRGLHLAGGFLGADQPAVDQVLFTFKGSRTATTGWRLATLKLVSDPVRFEASGSYDQAVAVLAAKGSVNLPAVAAQLPHLLSLHEQTRIGEGKVDFSLDVSGTPEELALQGACRTSRLAVVHGGRSFAWDAPLSMAVDAERRQGKTTVRTLQAHTPFLEALGSGSVDDFSFRATANLGRMSEELEKIFAFKYHGIGQLTLTGSSQITADGRYQLATRIGINQLALSRAGTPVLPPHNLLLTGTATALPAFFQYGEIHALQVEGEFWPGKFSFSAQDGEPQTGKRPTDCSLSGAFDLERLGLFYQGLAGVVPEVRWGGIFSFDGSGAWEDQRLSLEAMEGRVDRLAVNVGRYTHKEARVNVSMANAMATGTGPVAVRGLKVADNWEDFTEQERPKFLVDFQQQRLDVRHLNFSAAAVGGRGSLLVTDWRQPRGEVAAELQTRSDAAFLAGILKAAGWFPEDLGMKGRTRALLTTRSGGEQEPLAVLDVQVEPFALVRAKKKLFADPRLTFQARVLGNVSGDGGVKIQDFRLHTAPLRVAGTGLVQRRMPASLELQGTLTPDLKYFSEMLGSLIGQKIAMTGERDASFLFASPLNRSTALQQMTLSARLPVDQLRYRGIALHRLEIPVEFNRGKLQAAIAGELGGGRVTLTPQWVFEGRKTLLSLPAASQVLEQVVLQPSLQDRILAPLHPLFGSLAQPKGPIDLRLDEFSWPVSAKKVEQPVFRVTVGLDKVQLQPTRILRELLDLNGLNDKPLRMKEQDVACEGRDGRVTCKPVHLLAGEVEIGISGMVGKDRSLAYLVQMPVLAPLADKVAQTFQAGTLVSAEITGPLDDPVYDQAALLAEATDQLLKAAVEKKPRPEADKPSGNEP